MKLAIFVKNPDLRQDSRCRSLCDALSAEGMQLYDIASHADLQEDTDILLSIGGANIVPKKSWRRFGNGIGRWKTASC